MGTLKCKMCGGELKAVEGVNLCECEYCGSKQTIPTADDEKIMKLYDRANRLRLANEFDKAASVYENIIEESDTEAEAYWGLILCKYGVEYVDDPNSGDKIPTCHRVSFDSVLEDNDFELVMENAPDSLTRNFYRDSAKQIEEIRKGIIEVSGREKPYDIFICYKETAEDGDRTTDSVIAQEVYDALTDKGYRVFFSRISLEDKLGTEYEPYIFAALNSAKLMLAFGTSYDNYNAVWVKNEWSRYLKLMAKDKGKHLIPCYKDIDAYDIPKEFKHLQAQDMGKVGALQDLLRGIDKILQSDTKDSENNIYDAVASAMTANAGNNVNTLLERGFMMLEDEDFSKADQLFEEVLNQNPKCAEAYMGKLLAYYKAKDISAFIEKIYKSIFAKKSCMIIKPEFDMADFIKRKYVQGAKLSEDVLKIFEKSIKEEYRTNVEALSSYNEEKDYISIFCGLNNGKNHESKIDDKYYGRYCQYATESVKKKFNLENGLKQKVRDELEKEKSNINKEREKWSLDHIAEIIEEANQEIRNVEIKEFDSRMEDLQTELEKLSGFFKRKQREEIKKALDALKRQKENLPEPHGLELIMEEPQMPEEPKFYEQPIDSDTPIYPKQPKKAPQLKRREFSQRLNGERILQKIFKQHGIKVLLPFKFGKLDGKEIEWIELDVKENRILLLSKYALACQPYNTEYERVTWETCSLRKWLNETFLKEAFDEKEQAMVQVTTVTADKNPEYVTNPGNSTTDKVFLLSISEVEKYFASDEQRKCVPTKYALQQGADTDDDYMVDGQATCWWWLRSPGYNRSRAACVDGHGWVFVYGGDVYYGLHCVRPALWINLEP